VLKQADFLSLHVPFLDKPVIGKEEFALLKDGVGLVNASRGGVIDEQELIAALDSGKVSFAALDVFDNEPTTGRNIKTSQNIVDSAYRCGYRRGAGTDRGRTGFIAD